MDVFFSHGARCAARVDLFSYPVGSVGMLTVKVSYRIYPDAGRLSLADKQVPVFEEPKKRSGWIFDRDVSPLKQQGKVDLVVIGDAIAPGGRSTGSMTVQIELEGKLARRFSVTGNRIWMCEDYEKALAAAKAGKPDLSKIPASPDEGPEIGIPGAFPEAPPPEKDEEEGKKDEDKNKNKPEPKFFASDPDPFFRMPMDWCNAYGGTDSSDVSYPDNPFGKGYVMEPATKGESPLVAGVPLPNIEPAGKEIVSWKSRPPVAGCAFYPMDCAPRLSAGMKPPDKGCRSPRILGRLFNQAAPDFILDGFPSGAKLTVSGMTPSDDDFAGSVSFRLREPALQARLEEADGTPVDDPALMISWDLICATPEKNEVYVTGRAAWPFDEVLDPRRYVRILPDPAGGGGDE